MHKGKTIVAGLTGSLGAGKSFAGRAFRKLGADVIDADKIAHQALKKGTPYYKRIVTVFGRSILDTQGKISRLGLADLAFSSKSSVKKLCGIVHPYAIKKIKRLVRQAVKSGSAPMVVIDAPLLIETGLHKAVDYLIVVKTTQKTQIRRARKKTGLSAAGVIRRIKNQIPLIRKIDMADFIIDNEGSKISTEKQVKKIWKELNCGGK